MKFNKEKYEQEFQELMQQYLLGDLSALSKAVSTYEECLKEWVTTEEAKQYFEEWSNKFAPIQEIQGEIHHIKRE